MNVLGSDNPKVYHERVVLLASGIRKHIFLGRDMFSYVKPRKTANTDGASGLVVSNAIRSTFQFPKLQGILLFYCNLH